MSDSSDRSLLCSGARSQFRELGAFGQPVFMRYAQLRHALARELGEAHANLFAEPVLNSRDQSIDWYAPVAGEVRAYGSLPPEDRQRLDAELQRLLDDVRRLGGRLESSGADLATIVQRAVSFPDRSQIFVVQKQPVIAFWGFEPGTGTGGAVDLINRGAARPPVPTPPTAQPPPPLAPEAIAAPPPVPVPIAPVVTRSFWSRWWWLLLLLLLLLALLLLSPWLPWFRGCTPWGVGGQGSGVGEPLLAPTIAQLPGAAVQPATQPQPPTPVPQAPTPQPRPPTAAPQPPTPDPRPPVDTAPSDIPLGGKDVSVLEGKWRSITGLINREDKKPIEVEYEFGRDGNGTMAVRQQDGSVCTGRTRGRFLPDGSLAIEDQTDAACPDGTSYLTSKVMCSVGADGRAYCGGEQRDGNRYKVQLKRM